MQLSYREQRALAGIYHDLYLMDPKFVRRFERAWRRPNLPLRLWRCLFRRPRRRRRP